MQYIWSIPFNVWIVGLKKLQWAGHVAWLQEKRNAYRFFMEETSWQEEEDDGGGRWENSIKMDSSNIECHLDYLC